MRKAESKLKMEELWEEKYGHLPSNKNDLIKYIKEKYRPKDINIQNELDKLSKIGWREFVLEIPIIPSGTPRPRLSTRTNTFYVKGSAEHKKLIKKIIKAFDIICTRTDFLVETFQPTPVSSMSKVEILLAEEGSIRPLQDPDECPMSVLMAT